MKRDFIVFVIGMLSGMGLVATWIYAIKSHISNEIFKLRNDLIQVLSGNKSNIVATIPQPIPQHKS
jgi:hypothetical protein